MQWGGAAAIRRIRIRAGTKQEPRLAGTEGRRRQMEGRIAHVEPVWNRVDQLVTRHARPATVWRGAQPLRNLLLALKNRLENRFH